MFKDSDSSPFVKDLDSDAKDSDSNPEDSDLVDSTTTLPIGERCRYV